MILGGSPITVAVPPIFEARASEMRRGMGLILRTFESSRVAGTIRRTVVTLSRKCRKKCSHYDEQYHELPWVPMGKFIGFQSGPLEKSCFT